MPRRKGNEIYSRKLVQSAEVDKAIKALQEQIGKLEKMREGVFDGGFNMPIIMRREGSLEPVVVSTETLKNCGAWTNDPNSNPEGFLFSPTVAGQMEEEIGCRRCHINDGRGGMLKTSNVERMAVLMAASGPVERPLIAHFYCRGRKSEIEAIKAEKPFSQVKLEKTIASYPCSRGRIDAFIKTK